MGGDLVGSTGETGSSSAFCPARDLSFFAARLSFGFPVVEEILALTAEREPGKTKAVGAGDSGPRDP